MKVLVCGDRMWYAQRHLERVLDQEHLLNNFTLVIEGEASGADTFARQWAEKRGIAVRPFPANWTKFGKAAGPIRNAQMLLEGKPDLVIAFHEDLSRSKGTRNMIDLAKKASIPVNLYSSTSRVKL